MAKNLVNGEVLAEFLELTTGRVSQLKNKGVLHHYENSGQYDFLPNVKSYIKYLQSHGESKIKDADYKKSQARAMAAKAERLEFDLKAMKGEVIPIDVFQDSVIDIIKFLQIELNKLPDAVGRKTGCAIDVLDEITKAVDDWRPELHKKITKKINVRKPTSDANAGG